MLNVKDDIYKAITSISDNVSDTYPKNWQEMPAIQCAEEENKVVEYTDMEEQKAYVRYRLDIWDNKNTSTMAMNIDKAIAALGLKRSQCMDIDDPSGLKHKVMRYEMVIDVKTGQVYHNM